ncbi:MAG: methyltransferase domain-containing protein [Limnothrix sp. RL_2_0]|nr:methyltransferase domain-containing protein [Limnothrix sp. RL_2_0]
MPLFWETKYQKDQFRWDLGQPAPALVDFFAIATALRTGKVFVPGCGRGNDAIFLAQQGLMVTAVDFAPSAIAATATLAQAKNVVVELLETDIFTLPSSYQNQFQLLFEHTCFCAIAPEERPKYVNLATTILAPQGLLFGIFFTHGRTGGPPFGSTPEEIKALFASQFEILTFAPIKNSVPSRQGDEHWAIFRKRS